MFGAASPGWHFFGCRLSVSLCASLLRHVRRLLSHPLRPCLHIFFLMVSLGFSVPFANAALLWRFVVRSGDCVRMVGTRSGCPLCPPVAPGGGFTLTHFRTAAHAAKPPPAPPSGGCSELILRGHFPFIFARFRQTCIYTHPLRFLSGFPPFLSLLGCRSLCYGSSRFALYFQRNNLSVLVSVVTGLSQFMLWFFSLCSLFSTQQFISFGVCRVLCLAYIFAMGDACPYMQKRKPQGFRWYLKKTTIYPFSTLRKHSSFICLVLFPLHPWGGYKIFSPPYRVCLAVVHSRTFAMRRSRLPKVCILACARTWVFLSAVYLLGFILSLCFIAGLSIVIRVLFSCYFITQRFICFCAVVYLFSYVLQLHSKYLNGYPENAINKISVDSP